VTEWQCASEWIPVPVAESSVSGQVTERQRPSGSAPMNGTSASGRVSVAEWMIVSDQVTERKCQWLSVSCRVTERQLPSGSALVNGYQCRWPSVSGREANCQWPSDRTPVTEWQCASEWIPVPVAECQWPSG
jgi:hypothetical protein